MTSTTPTRIIAIVLAALALTAPVAGAMPSRDDEGVRTSSLAGTLSDDGYQDLRNPDQQAPVPGHPLDLRNPGHPQDLRNPDNRVPGVPSDLPQTMKPVKLTPVADDGGPSPLVFIVPGLALLAMLGTAAVYARSARRPARV